VTRIDAAPTLIHIGFRPNPPIDAMKIIELVQRNRHVKLAGNDKLRIDKALPEARERAQFVRDVLRSLGAPSSSPST
jgi:transcription-repair coupling factor (superfamily II helicase)